MSHDNKNSTEGELGIITPFVSAKEHEVTSYDSAKLL